MMSIQEHEENLSTNNLSETQLKKNSYQPRYFANGTADRCQKYK